MLGSKLEHSQKEEWKKNLRMRVEDRMIRVLKDRFILCSIMVLSLIYEIIMLYLFYRTDAVVPDEIWFYSIVESMKPYTFKEIINMPNSLGYGSIYWIILALLGDMKRIRIFSFICLSVLPAAIFLLQKTLFKRKTITILISMALLFSCPMTWFTGKIIGPELIGNAVGIIGNVIILFIVERSGDKRDISQYIVYLFGFGLIGISTGIKLYNVIFAVFMGLYVIYPFIQDNSISVSKRIKVIVLKSSPMIVGFTLGFIVANPILLIDVDTYMGNLAVGGEFSIKNIYDILFLHRIEWDLVYSGGINHGIISVVGLFILILASLSNKQERRLVISLLVSILGCVILGSLNGRFYCWYFLPMLFFIPLLCVSSGKIFWIIVFVNIFLVGKYTWFQINNKFEQISNIENEEEIKDTIDEAYAKYRSYSKYYFIDIGLQNYKMDDINIYDNIDNQFIVISERARRNAEINQLYEKAVKENDGYRLVESQNYIHILVYEENKIL